MLFSYQRESDTGLRIPSRYNYEISESKSVLSAIISNFFDLNDSNFEKQSFVFLLCLLNMRFCFFSLINRITPTFSFFYHIFFNK